MISLKIDDFRKSDESCLNTMYILTHAHTDHSRLPKRFGYTVYCSNVTCKLMVPHNPHITFVNNMVPDEWILLSTADGSEAIRVFCFDSEHCVGGIGLYCQQLSILHFGEGRPSRSNMAMLANIVRVFPPADPQKMHRICDEHLIKGNLTEIIRDIYIPDITETQSIIAGLLTEAHFRNVDVVIRIAHFGVLSALPHNGYTWLGAKPSLKTPGTRLCYDAFKLMHFPPSTSVFVCRARGNIPIITNKIEIMLSARWWFFQTPIPDLTKPVFDPKVGAIRVFTCSHASPMELRTNFFNQCSF